MTTAHTITPKSVSAKLAARVMYWDDERAIGNSILITLIHGFKFDSIDVTHVVGVDTVRDGIGALRATSPCDCQECIAALYNKGAA